MAESYYNLDSLQRAWSRKARDRMIGSEVSAFSGGREWGGADAASMDLAVVERLIESGKIDRAGVDRACRLQKDSNERLHAIVTSLGLVTERAVAEVISDVFEIPLVGQDDYPSDLPEGYDLGSAFLKQARVLPLEATDDGLILAMADPLDLFSRQAVELKFGKPVILRVAVPSEIEDAIERIGAGGKPHLAEIAGDFAEDEELADGDAERLKDLASEAPVIRLVNVLIRKAVEARASDVHIEPFESALRVRYRIDGELREVDSPPRGLRFAVVSRIKIMARLNIAERRLPQDGRIKFVVRGNEVDLRVSTAPTIYGESVVLRILDRSGGALTFDDLGFDHANLSRLFALLEQPNGIVLVTGPTGSGKTTTLYASLLAINSPSRKFVTVEDPVEYQIDGINQIQVKPQIGLGFAQILRHILRQDPDILMIGEIRDLETAQIAVQASLTGHLVLSTVHANSAAATVTLLTDMGVEDYLLTSTLAGVVAQRLVRSLCHDCREPYRPLPVLCEQLQISRFTNQHDVIFYHPKGCPKCDGSGFHGRSAISEVLVVDDDIRALVLAKAEDQRIHNKAVESGMRTMHEDGLHKVLAGVTSIEEIMRVTQQT